MFLQKYNFAVNYVPVKDFICSDTLSRAHLKSKLQKYQKLKKTSNSTLLYPASPSVETKAEAETLNDKILQRVASHIAQGWSKSRNQFYPELKPHYILRDELTVVNNLIHIQHTHKRNEANSTYWPSMYRENKVEC